MELTKFIFFTILGLSSLAFGQSKKVSVTFNEWAAHKTALLIHGTQTAQDIALYDGLTKRNKEQISNALKNVSKKDFHRASVMFKDSNTLIYSLPLLDISIGFQNFEKGEIFINNELITITSGKAFYNYRGDVDVVLARGHASLLQALLIPSACAADSALETSKKWASSHLAAWLTAAHSSFGLGKSNPHLNLFPLESLLQSYQNQIQSMANSQKDVEDVIVFECNDTNGLKKVSMASLVLKGPADDGIFQLGPAGETCASWKIEANSSGNYEHEYDLNPRRIVADAKGRIKPSQEPRGDSKQKSKDKLAGKSLFDIPPFYRFTKFAQDCCAEKGCYEKVQGYLRNPNGMTPKGVESATSRDGLR
jgi:hypothetical protein